MHISEGVLSPSVLASGAALTVAGLVIGLKKLDLDQLPKVALVSAAFFVASLIHVPIGPTSAHLILNGLCGLLLGWAAVPALFVALTLQAVLFQFGGLTALGANTVIMALPAVLLGGLSGWMLRISQGRLAAVAAFVAGAGAVFLSGLLAATALALTGEAFLPMAKVIVLAHLPIMAVEGLLTAGAVAFLARVRPALLYPATQGSKHQ